MRGVQTIDFDPINVDPNVLFTIATISANVGATTTLTLAADLGEATGVGRRIFLDNPTGSETNDNTTWTITGTDADGRAQTDTMTDVEESSASVVGKNVSTKYFNSVSGITMFDVEVDSKEFDRQFDAAEYIFNRTDKFNEKAGKLTEEIMKSVIMSESEVDP